MNFKSNHGMRNSCTTFKCGWNNPFSPKSNPINEVFLVAFVQWINIEIVGEKKMWKKENLKKKKEKKTMNRICVEICIIKLQQYQIYSMIVSGMKLFYERQQKWKFLVIFETKTSMS